MRRILHLSDLHFGRDDPALIDPLVDAVNRLEPDLVAISGDLTQRARVRQFEAARDFIDRIGAPLLTVPGNHDVPLDNLFLRFLAPFSRYRRWIGEELEPEHGDREMIVKGLNTVNRWSWQRGRISPRAVRAACDAFETGAGDSRIRIVVVHHPLEHGPDVAKKLTRGAGKAIDGLAECGADIVLTGHLHLWGAGTFAVRQGQRGVLQVQAGSALSDRLRGEPNDFNLLTIDVGRVRVERHAADGAHRFRPVDAREFVRLGGGWIREAERRPAA